MVVIRLKYRKLTNTRPMAKCWYCNSPTNSALYELDGSEIWCCKKCHTKHGKVRIHQSKKNQKKLNNSVSIKGKNKQLTLFDGGKI